MTTCSERDSTGRTYTDAQRGTLTHTFTARRRASLHRVSGLFSRDVCLRQTLNSCNLALIVNAINMYSRVLITAVTRSHSHTSKTEEV